MITSHRVIVKNHEIVPYRRSVFYTFSKNEYHKDYHFDYHWHNSIEITYVVKGEKNQIMQNQTIEAKQGTLLLTNSGIGHELFVKKGLIGMVLLIDVDYLEQLVPGLKNASYNLSKDQEAVKMIIDHLKLLSEETNPIKCHIHVFNIIDLLVDKLKEDVPLVREKHDELSEVLLKIQEFIQFNFKNRITLDDIANMSGYSKSYISTLFKEKTGITIFEYLRNIRLQQCLVELKNTNNAVVDIALNNGFSNIQMFNKVFKDLYHMTPNQYRNKDKEPSK